MKIEEKIAHDVDMFCREKFNEGPRWHLGASQIGHECDRFLWFLFRWAQHVTHSGRKYRLFNRGHLEEARFIEWLRGIGAEICEVDPETGNQYRISGVNGHFGGSLDGIAQLPEKYGIAEKILTEFKTASSAAFISVKKHGLKKEKPIHYAQMCIYGYKKDIKKGLYVVTNKNDDDLYFELVDLDHEKGKELEARAERIIYATEPPPRISESVVFYKCKYCDFADVCHKNAPVDINCRSCKFSEPVENGEWKCNKWNAVIPQDAVYKGCGAHESILNTEE